MNKPQIFGLSIALIAVIVLAQVWRSQPRPSYTPTPAVTVARPAAAQPEFAASESAPAVSEEPAPAPDAGAQTEPAPAAEPAEAQEAPSQ